MAIVISNKDYNRLKRPRGSFVDFMRRSPLYGVKIEFKREQTITREANIA